MMFLSNLNVTNIKQTIDIWWMYHFLSQYYIKHPTKATQTKVFITHNTPNTHTLVAALIWLYIKQQPTHSPQRSSYVVLSHTKFKQSAKKKEAKNTLLL